MMTAILNSANGQRVIRECQQALDRPVNSDEISRRFVIRRYAYELDIYDYELEYLLGRISDRPKLAKPEARAEGDV